MEDESKATGTRWSVGNGPAEQGARDGKPPRPEFWQAARPSRIDAALLALDAETNVLFYPLPCLSTGCYSGPASQVIAELQAQLDRQAADLFTLSEVAHILAAVNPGSDVRDLIRRMMAAKVKGRRLPREPGSKLPVLEGADSFTFLWVATPDDIDAWLAEQGAPYRFPKAPEAEPPEAMPTAAEPAPAVAPNGTGKKWTADRLAELSAYRDKHGTKEAAERFGITATRVRALLPTGKPATKGYSAFTHRPK